MNKKLILLLSINAVLITSLVLTTKNYKCAINTYLEIIEDLRDQNEQLTIAYLEKPIEEVYEIVQTENSFVVEFSNYYVGDGSSVNKVGAGLTTDQFDINEFGAYTYNGRIVIATATWAGIKSQEPALKKYTDIPSGFHIYHYGDEIEINIFGNNYPAIILDTCQASYWNTEKQRFDIFMADTSKLFGLKDGLVYE